MSDPIVYPRSPRGPKDHEDDCQKLVEQHQAVLIEFRDTVCLNDALCDATQEADWRDLSFGWFVAKGVTGDGGTGEPYYEAHMLATITRYTFQYWRP